jgi:tRNA pseudouridine38-40 synthase
MFDFICTIQYNGKAFSGWSKQKSAKTIQGTIEKAIQRVTKNANFKTIGASKTDAGVHASLNRILILSPLKKQRPIFIFVVVAKRNTNTPLI